MEALDGNAIAGALFEHFGEEMTAERGSCAHCGATSLVAELRLYVKAPGAVGRCPTCGKVVLVVVQTRTDLKVHGDAFRLASIPG